MSSFIDQESFFLGVDLGTQSCKIVLCTQTSDISPTCSLIAVGHSREILMNPCASNDHAEQDPLSWIIAIKEACQDLSESFKLQYNKNLEVNNIRSIGVSGHQHGLVLVDKDDNIVRPCMMWCDTRAAAEAKQLSDFANFACPAGFTAPKIMWLKKYEPENYSKTAKIMLPHDYVNYYLSGNKVHIMERGDGSGTGVFSISKNSFDKDLMDFIDKDLFSKFPQNLADPHQSIGVVDVTIFKELFPEYSGSNPILLAPGCGDNAMSTLAVTSVASLEEKDSSSLILSLGTSGTLSTISPTPLIDPSGGIAPFCDSTGNYLPLMCIQNCSMIPEEIRKSLDSNLTIEAITELATQENPGCEGVIILPYFSEGGERTPNWPDSYGCILGLKHGLMQRPGLLYRAALESITYALLRGYRLMIEKGLSNSLETKISLVGGGSKNLLWRQIIADVFQLSVDVLAVEITANASAVGAALQAAAISIGVKVGEVAIRVQGNSQSSCHPKKDAAMTNVYEASFQRHVKMSNCLFG